MIFQAAKNLMNAVVLTVKASYVASTKYPRQTAAAGLQSKPIVVWKMKVSRTAKTIKCNLILIDVKIEIYRCLKRNHWYVVKLPKSFGLK